MTTSVVLIHGLWGHSVSWRPWQELFDSSSTSGATALSCPVGRATEAPSLRHVPTPGDSRVFAVGDVRAGSMKRVTSAVGEGASAVASVHGLLAEA